MVSVEEKSLLALRERGPFYAAEVIKGTVLAGATDASSVCRAALLILAQTDDEAVRAQLFSALKHLDEAEGDDLLVRVVLSLCETDSERVPVDVNKLKAQFGDRAERIPALFVVWRGMELFNQGRGREATAIFARVFQQTKNPWVRDLLVKTYLRTAHYYIAKQKYDRAAEVLREALKVNSFDVCALHTLAILETEKTSLSSLEQIERSWARVVEIWKALHKVYPEKGYNDKVVAKHKYFAARFLQAGNWPKAKEELLRLIDVDPANSLAKQVLAALGD